MIVKEHSLQCLVESSNVTVCANELIQLKHSDVRPQAQYTTTQSLYAALDKCKDVVFITDDIYRLQVVGIYITLICCFY